MAFSPRRLASFTCSSFLRQNGQLVTGGKTCVVEAQYFNNGKQLTQIIGVNFKIHGEKNPFLCFRVNEFCSWEKLS